MYKLTVSRVCTGLWTNARQVCWKKKKKKKKKSNNNAQSKLLETRHISVVRWRIRNVLVLALYALQIVQLCAKEATK